MTPSDSGVLDNAAPATRNRFPFIDTLGWAVYLGISWTWCIGMFFPVLVIRQYGVAGWWSFAIPNVAGAAAMGWVLRTRRQSDQIAASHQPAIRAFSWITVAFHAFFLSWIAATYLKSSGVSPIIWILTWILPFLAVLIGSGSGFERPIAAAVLCLSIAIAIIGLRAGWLPHVAVCDQSWTRAPAILWCLAPVMLFGFLFCPYLDQTFLHARQSTDAAEARWSFTIGFGIIFAAMIVMTLAYSGWFVHEKEAPLLLFVHLLAQSGITMALHFRAVPAGRSPGSFMAGSTAVIAGVASAGSIAVLGDGQLTYRMFMGFYALPFPAYVFICMRPWRTAIEQPGRRQLRFLAIGVVLAAPAFLLAVIGYSDHAFLVGLALILGTGMTEFLSRKPQTPI